VHTRLILNKIGIDLCEESKPLTLTCMLPLSSLWLHLVIAEIILFLLINREPALKLFFLNDYNKI